MEMTIVNVIGTSVAGRRAALLPTLGGALRQRVTRAVTGDALGGRGFGFGITGIVPTLTTDPTLDVTPAPTG